MSSPSLCQDNTSFHFAPTNTDRDDVSAADIPRRLMRVKVLYTFDGQNKSNCLARLPDALHIPTVSIDETTQVGVIELKTCIQAIVTASPELVAQLGHDYTVYAYDYSEYETPLVGQGMLSWILASASPTPNAPAHQSQTMVTGRVCKNILGLFSNGIKETLEVKLKLVPVPTCLQSEYVYNMELYRSLSKTMPEGFNYNEWADFLKANPIIGRLTNNTPAAESPQGAYDFGGGVESIHEMLTRPTPSEGYYRGAVYQPDQQARPSSAYDSRASSPAAFSVTSYTIAQQSPHELGSRPASRTSVRSEHASRTHGSSISGTFQDQIDDGPPRKRARVTQVKRPAKSSFGAKSDSLRVTASTAASVRLHRPAPANSAAAIASIEQVPRAPTPRPNHFGFPPQPSAAPATLPTSLRRGSTDGGDRYVSPYVDAGLYSDNGCDSADDERGVSAGETPTMEMPSSPPIIPHCIPPSVPSSPGLPTLPFPATDSGFGSEIGFSRGENEGEHGKGMMLNSDISVAAGPTRERRKPDRSNRPWTTVTPGPMELLPKTRIPPPPSAHFHNSASSSAIHENGSLLTGYRESSHEKHPANVIDIAKEGGGEVMRPSFQMAKSTGAPDANSDSRMKAAPAFNAESNMAPRTSEQPEVQSCASTTRRVAVTSKPAARPRALPKSQTWSGEGAKEFFSDTAATAVDLGSNSLLPQPRSGSGAKRRLNIKGKLEARLAAGKMPEFCNNCGEIETPTWRKAYTRLEMGSPADIALSVDGTGIVGFEIIKGGEGDDAQYRVFKQSLEPEERVSESFQTLQLCNPCGLWFNKKGSMRPPEIWMKNAGNSDKPKRKRNTNRAEKASRKKVNCESDCSELPGSLNPIITLSRSMSNEAPESAICHDGNNTELTTQQLPPTTRPHSSSNSLENGPISTAIGPLNETTAVAALQRAIQSSPVGLAGSKHSPIELDKELTPKPTRRLLFPSPRKDGEVKLLDDSRKTNLTDESLNIALSAAIAVTSMEDNDKENCPPPMLDGDDDLADLFEDLENDVLHTTPSRSVSGHDSLKTPTPRSKQGLSLNHSAELPLEAVGLTTPTRSTKSAAAAPLTPFTAHFNALFPDALAGSPSRAIDLSAFGPLGTPEKFQKEQLYDYSEDFLSSDLPLPSSSPGNFFSLYVDPETSTGGLWSETSVFDNEAMALASHEKTTPVPAEDPSTETNTAVDFGAMIREVVGSKTSGGKGREMECLLTPEDVGEK
jgi:hypothetical protein